MLYIKIRCTHTQVKINYIISKENKIKEQMELYKKIIIIRRCKKLVLTFTDQKLINLSLTFTLSVMLRFDGTINYSINL